MADSEKTQLSASSILFLCNHNIIRSPMAEHLVRLDFGNRIYTTSAGLIPGEIDPFVTSVMDELGCELRGHVSQTIEDLDDTWFDVIVSLSEEADAAIKKSDRIGTDHYLYWPTGDPTVVQGSRPHRLDAYRAIRDQINERIRSTFSPS